MKAPIDPTIIARYRKVRDRGRQTDSQGERANATKVLGQLEARYPGVKAALDAMETAEAQAKVNADFFRAAASRAAAQTGHTDAQSAMDQIAFWAKFVEETIASLALDDPKKPLPSVIAYVETIDFGAGMMSTVKRTAARGFASMADRQLQEQVDALRTMRQEAESGRIPRAIKRRIAAMADDTLKLTTAKQVRKALLDECDIEVAEVEDQEGNEEIELTLTIPKAVWAGIVLFPDVLTTKIDQMLGEPPDDDDDDADDGDEDEDPDGVLDPDDLFDPIEHDEDEDSTDEEEAR